MALNNALERQAYDYFKEYCESVYSIDTSDTEEDSLGVKSQINVDNVVSGSKLRDIQEATLEKTASYLSKTFGPMGSNTKIIKGTNQKDVNTVYSKDGLKVLSNLINSAPIEASIVEELVEITKAVEKEVGDGTTSTVILSSFIFKGLRYIEHEHMIPPYKLMRLFKELVDKVKKEILDCGRECTLEDIYNIAMVSTNGNEDVARNIADIYEKYGMNVELTAGISNTTDSLVKIYDGLTITEGMSDPVFINNAHNNTSEIHNASVYHFVDPVDTLDMITLFEAILQKNIYEPIENKEPIVPTVIVCPRISKDMSATLKLLSEQLYRFDQSNASNNKPPILIITDVVASDEVIMDDIANLCGCKSIRKYIDKEVYKKDVELGEAPTVDTVVNFAGHAELVVADAKKTKFINPEHMKIYNDDGTVEDDPIYTTMINFLETEIANAKDTDSATEIGLLKRRLSALKANMVDYLVGGVTISERDALKDLVEDAIKNCKSAALYGVGYAANFMGLNAAHDALIEASINYEDISSDKNRIMKDLAMVLYGAYVETANVLYSSIDLNKVSVEQHIFNSLYNGKPFNISNGEYEDGDNVLCSIRLDAQILDTLCRIIGMMITCNQAMLMSTNLNVY